MRLFIAAFDVRVCTVRHSRVHDNARAAGGVFSLPSTGDILALHVQLRFHVSLPGPFGSRHKLARRWKIGPHVPAIVQGAVLLRCCPLGGPIGPLSSLVPDLHSLHIPEVTSLRIITDNPNRQVISRKVLG